MLFLCSSMKTKKFSILTSIFRHHHLHPQSHKFLGSLPHFYASSYPQTLLKHTPKQHHESPPCTHNSRTQVLESITTLKSYNLYQNSCIPISKIHTESTPEHDSANNLDLDDDHDVWFIMKDEARSDLDQEPILKNYYFTSILSHNTMESALSHHLSIKLSNLTLPSATLHELIMGVLTGDQEIIKAVKNDLKAVKERDPACVSYVHCFLHFKGFLACQAHRVAHKLWLQNRKILALLIQNRVSEVFALDIHPGAKMGSGLLLDHATGVVIGETAVVGDNVSILHNVTLGGTGKSGGDRHPKVGDGVLIGAGTCVLGNVRIGEGAKIGAGSVVVKDVPARTTAVGNPAKLIGEKGNPVKHDKIPSHTMDHTSHIEFYDYVV
ncbi:putative serine O-acetyltransferase [Helianthus debilis subsp. tardiflorus]